MKEKTLALAFATLFAELSALAFDAPKLLPFQGRLTDQNGVALSNGVRLVQFKIYDLPTGGSPVWAGELHRTTVNGGLVNVMLGSKTPFTGIDFNQQLYLEITVDINADNTITAADPPMLPRQAILPVVFAKEAADSRLLDGYDWSSLFAQGASNPPTAQISGNRIVAQTVTAAQISDGTITGQKLAASVISSAQIIDGTILPVDLSDGAVTASKVNNGAIFANHLSPQLQADAIIPPGSVTAYFGTTAPVGWLLCDGSAVSRSTYARLFAVVSTSSGNGNGNTTFNLPDLRGMFLRGADGTRGLDPDRASRTAPGTGGNSGNQVASVQTDSVQGHNHALYYRTGGGFAASGPGTSGIMIRLPLLESENTDGPTKAVKEPTDDGAHGAPRISSETRPLNAYVNYIIKY